MPFLTTNKQTNEFPLKKLFVPRLNKKLPQFYETRHFIPLACLCPNPDKSSPYPPITLLQDVF
jgi:hypothetical protein